MSNCQCGSEKKAIAPIEFNPSDTGGFCSLLGLDSFICPLIDKIPSLIGSPWKVILREVAKESLSIGFNQITGKFITASFCSTERPPLPPDITYDEVFLFLASYIPVVGGFANDDLLLNKITEVYLYQKWLDYCECKECEPFIPEEPFTNVGINSDCPPIQDKVAAQNYINQVNIANAGSQQSANEHNQANADYDEDSEAEALIAERMATGLYYEVYRANFQSYPEPPDVIEEGLYQFGCIDVAYRARNYKVWAVTSFQVVGIPINGGGESLQGNFGSSQAKPFLIQTLPTYSRCDCFPPPKLPILPPYDPPVQFCDRFPADPYCLPTPPEECETESVIVSLFRECNLERYSVSRKLNVTGNDEAIAVQVFDACGTDRVQANKVLLKCEEVAIAGCTDPTASNYNPAATVDDGSCLYGCSPYETEVTAYGLDRAEFGQKYNGFYVPYEVGDLNLGIGELRNTQIYLDHLECSNEFEQYFANGWYQYGFGAVNEDCEFFRSTLETYGVQDAQYFSDNGWNMTDALNMKLNELAGTTEYQDNPDCVSQFNQWYTDAFNSI